MKYYLIVLLMTPLMAASQPVIVWQECFGTSLGDYFNDAIATIDNGFLVAAYFEGTDGDATPDDPILHPIIVMKFDSAFNIEWRKEYGGSNGYNNTIKILPLSDGYLFGAFSSATDGDFVGNNGGRDFALLKTDFEGNKIWAKCYGGPGDDFIKSVMLTDDNSYLITGSSYFEGGDIPFHYGDGSSADAIIMKIDSMGEIIWVKNFGGSSGDGPIGDPVLCNSGIYQIHIFSASTDYDLVDADTAIGDLKRWIVNLNSSGEIVQQNYISSESDLTRFDGRTFRSDSLTIVIGSGNAESVLFPAPESHGGLEGAMAIFDNNLDLKELHQWGGSLDDTYYTFTRDEFGNYFFIGTSNSMDGDLPNNYNGGSNEDYWLLKTDSNLNKLWSINFGGEFEGGDLAGGAFLGNIFYKDNHIYLFTTCMVPDIIPDHDIQCGHLSNITGFNFSDAWILDFELPFNDIESVKNGLFQLFPNPAENFVNIKFSSLISSFQNYHIYIYDIVGNLISVDEPNSQTFTLDTSKYVNGIYIIKILQNNDFIGHKKFIVQH